MLRAAKWSPPKAAALVALVGLAVHEIIYHLSGATDFPFQVMFDGARIFVISHGGLDSLAIGILVVSVLLIIDAAKIRQEG